MYIIWDDELPLFPMYIEQFGVVLVRLTVYASAKGAWRVAGDVITGIQMLICIGMRVYFINKILDYRIS